MVTNVYLRFPILESAQVTAECVVWNLLVVGVAIPLGPVIRT